MDLLVFSQTMSNAEDIEDAVSRLPSREFAEFRAWFEAFDADRFDQRIEVDARDGKLDALADQAIKEMRGGRAREI